MFLSWRRRRRCRTSCARCSESRCAWRGRRPGTTFASAAIGVTCCSRGRLRASLPRVRTVCSGGDASGHGARTLPGSSGFAEHERRTAERLLACAPLRPGRPGNTRRQRLGRWFAADPPCPLPQAKVWPNGAAVVTADRRRRVGLQWRIRRPPGRGGSRKVAAAGVPGKRPTHDPPKAPRATAARARSARAAPQAGGADCRYIRTADCGEPDGRAFSQPPEALRHAHLFLQAALVAQPG